MGRMEEFLPLIMNLAVLIGGLIALPVAGILHRRHPPETRLLTDSLISRSWNTGHIGLLLFTLLSLNLLAGTIGQFFYEEDIPLVRLAVTLILYAIITGLIFKLIGKHGETAGSLFGLNRKTFKQIRLAPLLYFAAMPLILLTSYSYQWLLEWIRGQENELQDVAQVLQQEINWLQISYTAMAVIIAPIYEEILFRGIFFPYLVQKTGLIPGMLIISACFAVMHFHLPSFVPLMLLSATLCLSYWRTQTLWVPIGIHAIFNTVTAIALRIGA